VRKGKEKKAARDMESPERLEKRKTWWIPSRNSLGASPFSRGEGEGKGGEGEKADRGKKQ